MDCSRHIGAAHHTYGSYESAAWAETARCSNQAWIEHFQRASLLGCQIGWAIRLCVARLSTRRRRFVRRIVGTVTFTLAAPPSIAPL